MTYGIPYTLATALGDMPVVTVQLPDAVPDGFTAVAGSGGPVMLVPTVALTPVDTTPPEPEPGAWDIGGVIAVCVSRGEWRVPSRETPGPEGWSVYRFLWPTVWEKLGGPGITPRRLVPEPEPVELPWDPHPLDVNDLGKTRTSVRVDGYYVQDENVVGRVGNVVQMLPDEAEEKAAALLAAARAAREVKP